MHCDRADLPSSDPWRARYGDWAVITGASDGIGRAIAEQLAGRGLDLVLVARRADLLGHLAVELSGRYAVQAHVLQADLEVPDEWRRVAAATASMDVGLLAACAGFGSAGPLLESEIGDELGMIAVNCSAVLGLTHHFGRRFAARGRGGIVLMSSLLAFQGVPLAANYAATKAYVQSLAEGLRPELAKAGVDLLASAPGPVRSGFAARAGMTMGLATDPASVAVATLDALGRRGTVRPGPLSKLLEASFIGQPRVMRGWILGKVMRGMMAHRARRDA